MTQAYQVLVDRLRGKGIQQKMHLLDNECLADFKERIKVNGMKYQLVPPHDHQRDIAEKAILGATLLKWEALGGWGGWHRGNVHTIW